jgi:hypothetical protein
MTRSLPPAILASTLGLLLATGTAFAAGPFDGVYGGPQHETVNSNSGYCRDINRDAVRLTIRDNVAHYEWGQPLDAPVAADGSFFVDKPGATSRVASGTILLKGRVSGGNLEADVGGSRCAAHLTLKKM